MSRVNLPMVSLKRDALGVEPVDRFVEDEDRGVAEQRRGDAQPLLHAEREGPDRSLGDGIHAGELQDLADTVLADAVGLGDGQQVAPGAPCRMQRVGVEQRADVVQGSDDLAVPAAAGERPACGGSVETEDHPHRGGLAGAVRAEKAGDVPGTHREAKVIQSGNRAEALGELVDLDHGRAAITGSTP